MLDYDDRSERQTGIGVLGECEPPGSDIQVEDAGRKRHRRNLVIFSRRTEKLPRTRHERKQFENLRVLRQ